MVFIVVIQIPVDSEKKSRGKKKQKKNTCLEFG